MIVLVAIVYPLFFFIGATGILQGWWRLSF